MNCKRCGAKLSEGVEKCMTCGFSEQEVKEKEQKALESITISKNPGINKLYQKIFGSSDKNQVKRLFKYIIVIFVLIWLFFHFFIYVDIPNRCFITIRPAMTEFSNTTIKKGIRYLKRNFYGDYVNFCRNVSSIDPNISCGGFGGGCYSEYNLNPGVIDISTTFGDWQGAAKVIIHETCHAVQFKEKRPFSEAECYQKDSVIPWR